MTLHFSPDDDRTSFHLLQCQLCKVKCRTSNEFVFHHAEHFNTARCAMCQQQMIQIENKVYHLNFGYSCNNIVQTATSPDPFRAKPNKFSPKSNQSKSPQAILSQRIENTETENENSCAENLNEQDTQIEYDYFLRSDRSESPFWALPNLLESPGFEINDCANVQDECSVAAENVVENEIQNMDLLGCDRPKTPMCILSQLIGNVGIGVDDCTSNENIPVMQIQNDFESPMILFTEFLESAEIVIDNSPDNQYECSLGNTQENELQNSYSLRRSRSKSPLSLFTEFIENADKDEANGAKDDDNCHAKSASLRSRRPTTIETNTEIETAAIDGKHTQNNRVQSNYCLRSSRSMSIISSELIQNTGNENNNCAKKNIPSPNLSSEFDDILMNDTLSINLVPIDLNDFELNDSGSLSLKKPAITKRRRIDTSRRYQCHICKKYINFLPNLKRHLHHHYTRPLTCDICGAKTRSWVNMLDHKKTHSDFKEFMCSVCGRFFHHQFNMKAHMAVHTGIKEHKCDDCGKNFAHRSTLLHHRLVHTREKPNKCTVDGCQRAFMYKVDLKRHLYGKHRIYTKKYECKYCGKILPENKLLKIHLERSH